MSEKRSPLEALARQLYRDHKQTFDLILPQQETSPFVTAAHQIFGDPPQAGKIVRVQDQPFILTGSGKAITNFFPLAWHEALGAIPRAWKGCEKWWAGYPIAMWMEQRAGDDKARGYLVLNAEIGPLADHDLRQDLITCIASAAAEKGMTRIRFPARATARSSLYSRFLRDNAIALENPQSARAIETRLLSLLSGFAPEIDCVADALACFGRKAQPGAEQS
ncbi:hypothetical protein [Rhizobium sp. SSA_523]|uniref:hypothetical protein n=1 Tax=Rhizobium sp. SSA_523 TaxID=2952477 RepID=UPI002581477C|nr:hypothetical protein [Rhizobium sp. SSA_523]MCO5730575.1 hypothetical protein [Rhizobium sp. SSA_523]WKC25612.1 hypothetical protein QTJ18_16785 [Rhizobium sp. SSA_523]